MGDKKQINPANLRFAPKQAMTNCPAGLYAEVARTLGARVDSYGTPHMIREELSQSEVMARYEEELARRYDRQSQRPQTPTEYFAEGYDEGYFSYHGWEDSGEQPLEEWSLRLPKFLQRKNSEPAEPEPALSAPKRNRQPGRTAPQANAAPSTSVPTHPGTSAPTTHIFYHQSLKRFAGMIHGKPFKPMDEARFFKHLIANHGMTPEHSERFISRVKAGSTSGFEPVRAEHHLDHAHRFLSMALDHHNNGDEKMRDKRLEVVGKHLDYAHDLMARHLKRNRNEIALGKNHPVFHQIAKIHGMLHLFDSGAA
jgi:hypothetical protein